MSNRETNQSEKLESSRPTFMNRVIDWVAIHELKPIQRYGLAIVAVVVAVLIKLGLNTIAATPLGASTPFVTIFGAIMVTAWFAGFGPGLLVIFLGAVVSKYFFLEPGKAIPVPNFQDVLYLIVFVLEGLLISGLCETLRKALRSRAREIEERKAAQEELAEGRELYAVTLGSIGDAVISTDVNGRISFMNQVAQQMTGWNQPDAAGLELSKVFNIINEETLQPVESPVQKVLSSGMVMGLANHTLLVTRSGRHVQIDDSGAPIKNTAGKIIGVVLVFRDVTDRKYQEEQQTFLVRSSELLGSSLDRQTTLQNIVKLVVPFLADWCSIDLLDDEGKVRRVASAHIDPEKQNIVHALHERFPYPPGQPHPLRDLLLAGKSVLNADIGDKDLQMMARSPEHLQTLKELDLQSGMTVPLMIRGQAIGAFTLAITESSRRYHAQDLTLAQELARRASFALDNARLFGETQVALAQRTEAVNFHRHLEEQLTALVEASDSLLGSLQLSGVLPAILDLSRRLVAADAYGVWRLIGSSGEWRTLTSSGLSPEYVRKSITSFQITSIKEPIIVEDTANTRPALAARMEEYRKEGIRALLIAPLRIEGAETGTIVFYFREPHRFSQIEIRIAIALANMVAIAVRNAELYEQQTVLREQSESARRRLSFLSEASSVLASSLDYTTTLQRVAQLAVPAMADWCTVHIVNQEGIPEQVAVAHQDPAKIEWVMRLQKQVEDRYPYDPDGTVGMPKVIRTAQPEILPEITDEMLVAAAPDEETLQIMREVGYTSAMSVPMIMRDKVIGVLAFVSTKVGHNFGAEELSLAQELAGRAAMAVDNALLYAEAQRAITVREDFLSMAAHELKTPVTSLRGFAQLLVRQLDRQKEIEPLRLRRALETINQQSERLLHLIVRLLDLSKLQAGRLVLEPEVTNLTPLIERVVEGLSNTTEIHNLEIDAPDTVLALVDPLRIEQIVTNLVDNAIKYSPEGGEIKLTLAPLPSQKMIKLTVSDRGIGISQEHRERIFEPFYQAQTRGFAGIGMGLFITRQIIELHEGQIEVEFPDDGGTSFVVTLPDALN